MILPTWNQFLLERKGSFSYSCLLCNIPDPLRKEIVKWSHSNIKKNELYTAEEGLGYEDESHITVLYGLHSNNAKLFKSFLKDQKPIKATLGKVSHFSCPNYDVVKLSVNSPDLHKLNGKLKANFEFTSNFPDYKPHCTLAYVKKGFGRKYEGRSLFQGKTVTFNEVTFSPSVGSKVNIPIT